MTPPSPRRQNFINNNPGGKVKPLKAAKKEKKELDEDELAYKEKLRAGMFCLQPTPASYHSDTPYRCQGQEGHDGGGQGQEGSSQHRPAGH